MELPGVDVRFVGSAWVGDRLWAGKWQYLLRGPRVRRLLAELRPDVTLATYFRSNGLVGALTRNGPLVVSSRGPGDYEFWLPFGLDKRLVRWIASRADRLHASSPELVRGLEACGVPAARCTVIPLGIEADAFRPREGARLPGPLRIICTRKHLPIYDNATIVRALAQLRDEGMEFEFRFVGSGNRLPLTRRLVRSLELEDCVEFIGEVDREDVREQLNWADVFVSANLSDGSPSSLFEAMACRLLPVVSDIVANRDWLKHGETALLFPVGDAGACASAIRRAEAELPRFSEALDRNRAVVAERADRRGGLERLEALLEATIEEAALRRETESSVGRAT